MAIIEVNQVTKVYKLGQLQSLKSTIASAFGRLRGAPPAQPAPFKALDCVDFRVDEGEVLGIIGTNGAGKSTLLKLLAGITVPTLGSVAVRGKVAPLIEVGAGLVGDLSGRENIFLNGAILGISRKEIRKKFDEIVAFAELEDFIDTPIKRYSSGMAVRLGFAIATSVDADILIVDEVLAVGDLAFQRKCFDRMEDMIKRKGKTVLLVTHNVRQVERLCQRAILMEHGRIIGDGVPKEICNLFYERNDEKIRKSANGEAKGARSGRYELSGQVELLEIALVDETGAATEQIRYNSEVRVRILIKAKTDLVKPIFAVGVHTTDFLYLASRRSLDQLPKTTLAPGVYEVICKIEHFPFLPGVYSLRVSIASGEVSSEIFYGENLAHFQVTSPPGIARSMTSGEGFFALDTSWALHARQPGEVEALLEA